LRRPSRCRTTPDFGPAPPRRAFVSRSHLRLHGLRARGQSWMRRAWDRFPREQPPRSCTTVRAARQRHAPTITWVGHARCGAADASTSSRTRSVKRSALGDRPHGSYRPAALEDCRRFTGDHLARPLRTTSTPHRVRLAREHHRGSSCPSIELASGAGCRTWSSWTGGCPDYRAHVRGDAGQTDGSSLMTRTAPVVILGGVARMNAFFAATLVHAGDGEIDDALDSVASAIGFTAPSPVGTHHLDPRRACSCSRICTASCSSPCTGDVRAQRERMHHR